MSENVKTIDGLTLENIKSSEDLLFEKGVYPELIKAAVDAAVKVGASDIHFEPTSKGVRIKMRIAGDIVLFKEISVQNKNTSSIGFKSSFFTELKRISNLSIGQFGTPQDSRISFSSRNIDVRVNLRPVLEGEKVVYRLIDRNRPFSLEKSGLDSEAISILSSSIKKKSGIIIISGETGSGKTTTLYSLLNKIDRLRVDVSTLEDPIEVVFPNVSHTQISSKIDFAKGLKALMRQDPDIILLGEIRDTESAKKAFEAASTGHLVLTTLHANSAQKIVNRLIGLGVEKFLIDSNLILSCHQKLFRNICSKCSIEASKELIHEIETELGKSLQDKDLFSASKNGCAECNSGYLNERTPIFEYIYNNGKIKKESLSIKDLVLNLSVKGVIDAENILKVA